MRETMRLRHQGRPYQSLYERAVRPHPARDYRKDGAWPRRAMEDRPSRPGVVIANERIDRSGIRICRLGNADRLLGADALERRE
jgi:hypothetical protein